MRGLKIGSAIAVALVAAACADQTPTAPEAFRGPSLATSGATGPVCPAGVTTPLIWKTNKGETVEVGSVVVSNDETNLYVSFTTTESWEMDYTFALVASKRSDVPQKNNGDVKLDKFSHVKRHRPMASAYAVTIPLGGLKAGDEVLVVAPAVVEGFWAKKDGKDPKRVSKTAWSGNTKLYPNARENHPAVDATFLRYTIAACDAPPPPPPPPAPAKTGVITITFDDGFKDAYTYGYNEMKKYGIVGNIAVNPGPIDSGWTGYLSLAELNEMHLAGWSVVSHTYNHPDLKTLSDADLDRELKSTQDWIRAKGYRGANIFIVPFHSWGAREEAAVKRYYNTARGNSVFQFVPDSMATYPTTNQYGLTGYEPEYAPYTTPEGRAATRAVMQKAVDQGKFVDIFFHQVPAANAGEFAEMVKIMAEFKPYIKAYATLFPGA